MKLWRRNKAADDVTLPQEVQDYYAADKRDRRGVAGLLAVGTLIVTILLAVGLFFGGRWAYRSIRHTNSNNKTAGSSKTGTSSTSTNKPSSSNGNNGSGNASSGSANSSSNTPSPQPGGAATNPTSGAPVVGSPAGGTGSTTVKPPTSSGSTGGSASASSSNNGLPNTGNGGSVAAFVAATLGSIVIAELYQRRKLTR